MTNLTNSTVLFYHSIDLNGVVINFNTNNVQLEKLNTVALNTSVIAENMNRYIIVMIFIQSLTYKLISCKYLH